MEEPDPIVLGLRMKKHYLASRIFSVPFSDKMPIFQLKFWLRSKLLSVSGKKIELLDRIRNSREFNGKSLTFDITEEEISFDSKSIDELTTYQINVLMRAKGLPIADRRALVSNYGERVSGSDIRKALNRVTDDNTLEREREVLRRIGREISETDNVPVLSQEDIEVLIYDDQIGYLGVPQMGVGMYRRDLRTLFLMALRKLFSSERAEEKDKHV